MKLLIKKESGASFVEAALITPVFFAIIFYILELMFVNNAQNALIAITAESTRHFSKFCDTSKFTEFIAKYKEKYAPRGEIKYYINVYDNIDDMNIDSVRCGEEIFWPTEGGESITFIDKNGNSAFDTSSGKLSDGVEYKHDNLSGKFFVITFVINYQFTNELSKTFFLQGTNTMKIAKNATDAMQGDLYLLHSRGVGICE